MGHCGHILEVMFFVDVDGTLSDFMRTMLVYSFCGLNEALSEKNKTGNIAT